MKRRILFLCTHNSARSQMAEGRLRHLASDRFDVHSAGTEQERLASFRAVRDAIRGRLEDYLRLSSKRG